MPSLKTARHIHMLKAQQAQATENCEHVRTVIDLPKQSLMRNRSTCHRFC